MLYARILRPPAHDAKLVSTDISGVKTIEGASIVQDGEMIAVLHQDPELAEQALKKIKAQWDRPKAEVDSWA